MNFCKECKHCSSSKVLQDICNMEQKIKDEAEALERKMKNAEDDIRKGVRSSKKYLDECYKLLLEQHVTKQKMRVYWNTDRCWTGSHHLDRNTIIRDEHAKILNELFEGYFTCQNDEYNTTLHNTVMTCQQTSKRFV